MTSLPTPVRIILVDDHELVRSGIRALLTLVDGVTVVAEARDGLQLLALLETVETDIVMCDLSMPGMDGLEAITRVHNAYPQVRTVALSMESAPALVRRVFASGACGYIGKQAAAAELGIAIRTILAGGRYVSPTIARVMLQPPDAHAPEERLTPRQVEILTLIAEGRSAREIGEQLGLSSKTVDVHRARIMERVDIHDIAGLTRYAVRHGLVR